jgi:dihydrodipicolinate synthase/N-acetylneuraminate lyase
MRYHQAILASCEIPWTEKEELMEDLFREEVRRTLQSGFNNLYIFGTAGEGYAVDTPRFRRIVDIFFEETNKDSVFPQVGIIGLSTANILERLSYAYEVGFRTFQISMPSWGVLNDNEVLKFFTDVCGAYPDCRFLHYNLPRTKRVLSGDDYRRLADAVPNLAATKNTGTNHGSTIDLIEKAPEIQHFLGEAMLPFGTLCGECSLLSSYGPAFPLKTKQLFEYAVTGQTEKLFRFHKEYLAVVRDVAAPALKHQRIDGAYDKLWVRLGGLPMPLRLLSPYESLPEETYEECRRILHEKYPDWVESDA